MEKVRGWMLFVIGLVAGFVLGYFDRKVFTLTWKGEIDAGDLFNFINAIIFALLLQQYVTKRLGDKRAEKEHLITLVKESIKSIQDVRNKFLVCYNKGSIEKTDDQEIKLLLKNFSNSLAQIRFGLKHCEYTGELKNFSQIDNLYFKYKAEITGGTFPSTPYHSGNFHREETGYQSIYSDLQKLILTITTR